MKKKENRFVTLEDIDRAFEKMDGDIGSVNLKTYKSRKQDDSKQNAASILFQYGRILLIPVVIILIIAAVLVSGSRRKKAEEEASIAASIAESQAAEAEALKAQAAKEAESSQITLESCTIPEISILVNDYFDARMNSDTVRLREIFGRKDTSEDAELKAELEAQKLWIQEYMNVSAYLLPGLEGDAYICLITYDMDFRRTDTIAPGIMYTYAEHNADGQYVFAENLNSDRQQYIAKMLAEPEVKQLIDERNDELRSALASDGTLALIYTSFLNGDIYKDFDIDLDREQEIDLFMNPEDSILLDASQLEAAVSDRADSADNAEDSADIEDAEDAEAADAEETEADGDTAETDTGNSEQPEPDGAVQDNDNGDASEQTVVMETAETAAAG